MRHDPRDLAALDERLGGRFEVLECYGGGEGWSAAVREHGTVERRFLKVLNPGHEVHEASLLASLQHPRIPRILEVGSTRDGRAYLLRQHLDGESLAAALPLGATAAIDLAVQLLEVLAFVHLRGVLHLDLKPANVLRYDADGAPQYSLLDFGLGQRGATPTTGGTVFFAAPEQLLGVPPDPRTDLFSLGALLFAAVRTGQRQLQLERFVARFPRTDFFTAVGELPSELPAPFDTLLPRLTARSPEHRCADAQEALEELVGGSGRPSTRLLRPDPIQLFGDDLQRHAVALATGVDLRVEGGDADDRQALALHAACTLDGVKRVADAASGCTIHRGGDALEVFEIPALEHAAVEQHLEAVLGLDAEAARGAAAALRDHGAVTPAGIARALIHLVESGRILPDGPRWLWPDAASGRVNLQSPALLEPSLDALRQATARGHVEAALRAYRAAAPSRSAAADRGLRAALAEGFVLGGEPRRALPLVHDLPLHAARALLELGHVHSAERALRRFEHSAEYVDHDPTVRQLRASLADAQGDLPTADRLTSELAADPTRPQARVLRGLVLSRLGRPEDALAMLRGVLEELDAAAQPFLRAAALTNLADIERTSGDLPTAQQHHEEALTLFRYLGHVRYTAVACSNLGVLAKDLGDASAARDYLRRARALYLHIKDVDGAARADANLGIVSLETGDARTAARRLQRAATELERLGSREPLPALLVHLARAHASLGDTAPALACLERAGPLSEDRLVNQAAKVRELLGRTATGGAPALEAGGGARAGAGAGAGASSDGRARGDQPVSRAVFQTFVAVNRRLATEADLDRAMAFLLDAAVTLTGGRLGLLLVARPDGLRVEVRSGPASEAALAFSRSMVNRAVQTQRVLTGADALADRDLLEMPSVRNLERRSAICLPFTAASGAKGAIYVEHPGRANVFGDRQKQYLDVLGDQAAIAVDRQGREALRATEDDGGEAVTNPRLRQPAVPRAAPPTMLGQSKPMTSLRNQIAKLASSQLPVLVLGETGTGKELVARALHTESPRRGGCFVSENCSAIPTELMESELFGYRKGAFTGADDDRPGLLELASGGTLFLDEIGDMPPTLQAKLLRVLQENCSRRLGDHRTIQLDLRLVTATHRTLPAMIAAGTFRADLYYRLAAVEIRVPALRERGDDVLLLADAFLARLNAENARAIELTEAARQQLADYTWPGNVRQLGHAIARAFVLAEGDEVASIELPPVVAMESEGGSWPAISIGEAEARTIEAALKSTGGDKTKAAKVLRISRTALYEKLKRIKRGTPPVKPANR